MPIASSAASLAGARAVDPADDGDDVAAGEERDQHPLRPLEPTLEGFERFRSDTQVAGEPVERLAAVGATDQVADDEGG